MKVLKILLCGLLLALPVLAEESDDRQTATSLHYVSHELDTRQNKLTTGTNAALTYTNAAGGVGQRTVKENLNGGTTDTSLPMVNAVNAGLNTKQNDIATIDDHTAVTYTNSVGTIGQKGIYQDTGTYAEQSDNLIDAKTFNAALKNGLDNEFVCADRPDAHSPTGECWLWEIHNETQEKSQNILDVDAWFKSRNVGYTKEGNEYVITTLGNGFSHPLELPENTYTLSVKDVALGNGANYPRIDVGVLNNGRFQVVATVYKYNKSVTGTFNAIRLNHYAEGEWYSFDEIQLEVGTTPTPFQPYNANIYIPQNQN